MAQPLPILDLHCCIPKRYLKARTQKVLCGRIPARRCGPATLSSIFHANDAVVVLRRTRLHSGPQWTEARFCRRPTARSGACRRSPRTGRTSSSSRGSWAGKGPSSGMAPRTYPRSRRAVRVLSDRRPLTTCNSWAAQHGRSGVNMLAVAVRPRGSWAGRSF